MLKFLTTWYARTRYAHIQKYWAMPPIFVNKVSAANSTPIFWPERTCETRSGISKDVYVLGRVIRKLYVITTCLFNILSETLKHGTCEWNELRKRTQLIDTQRLKLRTYQIIW